MFLKVAYTMKHRPRVKTISVYTKHCLPETGSGNNFRYIIDINAISSFETMLCEVAITTDHKPVSFSYSNHEKLGMANQNRK